MLELLRSENACELLPRFLADGVHLLFHDHRGDRCVAAQRGDLLVAVGKNRFELRCLIGRQVEPFAEPGGFAMRVGSVVVGLWCWGRGCLRLLRIDETAGEGQGQGGRK